MYLLIVLVSIHLAGVAHASTPAPFMPVTEVQAGMQGIGLTVFSGTQVDTFGVDILGVVHNGLGVGRDLILARLYGGPLEETGVVRGMSGSPVFVEDRLIGAVAYGWSFAKSPICGITPIEQMVEVMMRPMDTAAEEAASRRPSRIAIHHLKDIDGAFPPRSSLDSRERPAMEPLGTPVWVAGMPHGAAAVLREVLEPLGMHVLSGPAGTSSAPAAVIEPGAALGVQLIEGDMSATGIGTVTLVDEDQVLAFGHPMMMLGAASLPLTAAHIYEVLPSRHLSFKLGAATSPVGAMRQDRSPGIAGRLGPVPSMLPVSVGITTDGDHRPFRFRVARHEDLTASLVRATLLGSLESRAKLFGDATVELKADIGLTDAAPIRLNQRYSGPAALVHAAVEAVRPIHELMSSPLPGLQLDSLAFDMHLHDHLATAVIRSIRAGSETVHPGERLEVTIELQPHRDVVQKRRIQLTVPRDLAPGPVQLRVGAGNVIRGWDMARRPDAFRPRDASHLVQLLNQVYRNDVLVAELFRETPGLTLDGRELPSLPPSASATLRASASSGHLGPSYGQVLDQISLPTEYVLEGQLSVELKVERRPGNLQSTGVQP